LPPAVTAPRGGGRFRRGVRWIAVLLLAAAAAAPLAAEPHSSHSVARQWNELQLQAIRKDYAFPHHSRAQPVPRVGGDVGCVGGIR
jgi:hypothetical protein